MLQKSKPLSHNMKQITEASHQLKEQLQMQIKRMQKLYETHKVTISLVIFEANQFFIRTQGWQLTLSNLKKFWVVWSIQSPL
jgi:hypothetical protein